MPRRIVAAALAVVGVIGLIGSGCRDARANPDPPLVFGAASAADALREATARYGARDDGGPVALHIGASGALARQIELGAPADLLVAASPDELDRLVGSGLARASDRWALAVNRLVIVVRRGLTPPSSAAALTEARFERIVIGNPATSPVGRYAIAALDTLGLRDALAPRLLSAEHARQALAWVERGDVDAALVYATDARHAGSNVTLGPPLDAATHPPIRYEALLLSDAGDRARQFAQWLAGDEAGEIFATHGFLAVDDRP